MNQQYSGPPFRAQPQRRNNGCLVIALAGCGGMLLIVFAIFVVIAVAGVHWSTRGGAASGGPTGPAPYVVLEQWSYPCGGNGAHGARVMLKSHNPRDLPKAWAYYDASIGHDRSKCIHFEAYANEAALRIGTGHHAGPRYTDADTRTEWLNEYMYQLNVNNGYEAWIYGIKRYPNGAIDIDKHVINQGT